MKHPVTISKGVSIWIMLVAYLVALLSAIMVVRATSLHHPLAQLALGDLVVTAVIFIFSVVLNNSSMYDPYWSLKPAVFAVYYLMLDPGSWILDGGYGIHDTENGIRDMGEGVLPSLVGEGSGVGYSNGPRIVIASVLMFMYSLRLTSNFFRDWPGLKHEDWRYRNFRTSYPKSYWLVSFFGIHFFPTVMVYLGCLPLFGIWLASPAPLNLVDLAGGIVVLGSIALAFMADEQLRHFRINSANKGLAIDTGLWSTCRHPNYLGEILTWRGLFLFGLAASVQFWWTGIGAVMITLMFLFISIPMIEKRNLQGRQGYIDYIGRVPELFPKLF